MTHMVYAEIKMDKPPSFEDYLSVENTIDAPPAVEAPKMDLGLKGMVDDRSRCGSILSTSISSTGMSYR